MRSKKVSAISLAEIDKCLAFIHKSLEISGKADQFCLPAAIGASWTMYGEETGLEKLCGGPNNLFNLDPFGTEMIFVKNREAVAEILIRYPINLKIKGVIEKFLL
jgi:hypothetical protein